MNFKKLETIHDFENLKEGDRIIVKWSDYFIKNHKAKKIKMYYEIDTIPEQQDVICQCRENHYFNWDLFVKGQSWAEEVYLVTDNE